MKTIESKHAITKPGKASREISLKLDQILKMVQLTHAKVDDFTKKRVSTGPKILLVDMVRVKNEGDMVWAARLRRRNELDQNIPDIEGCGIWKNLTTPRQYMCNIANILQGTSNSHTKLIYLPTSINEAQSKSIYKKIQLLLSGYNNDGAASFYASYDDYKEGKITSPDSFVKIEPGIILDSDSEEDVEMKQETTPDVDLVADQDPNTESGGGDCKDSDSDAQPNNESDNE